MANNHLQNKKMVEKKSVKIRYRIDVKEIRNLTINNNDDAFTVQFQMQNSKQTMQTKPSSSVSTQDEMATAVFNPNSKDHQISFNADLHILES